MTLHRFKIFAAVAKHRNVTHASRELYMSQPSASYQLKLLQDNYKVTLVRKNGRGVELTEEGQSFLQQIEPILFYYQKLLGQFPRKPSARTTEAYTIGGSYGPSSSVIPGVMGLFRKSHPTVCLKVHTGYSHDIEQMVLQSRLEIALVSNPVPSPSLSLEPYRTEKLLPFVTAEHPLSRKASVTLSELVDRPLIIRLGKGGKSAVAERLARAVGKPVDLKIAMSCDSPDAVKAAVRRGMGVGILYEDVLEKDLGRGLFVEIKLADAELLGQSWIVYSRNKPLSPYAREILALMRLWREQGEPTKRTTPTQPNPPSGPKRAGRRRVSGTTQRVRARSRAR